MPPSLRGTMFIRAVAAFIAGVVVCTVLAVLCHLLDIPFGFSEPGYPYTGAITAYYLPVFVFGGPAAAVYVARLSRRSWPFALGMIVPLAVALVVELSLDPTSHNLFPFEIVFVWGPAFLLSWGAGAIALSVSRRAERA